MTFVIQVIRSKSRMWVSVVIHVQFTNPVLHFFDATLVGNFNSGSAQLLGPAVLLAVVPAEPGNLDPHQTEVDPVHGTSVFFHVVDEDVQIMARRQEVPRLLQQEQYLRECDDQHGQ